MLTVGVALVIAVNEDGTAREMGAPTVVVIELPPNAVAGYFIHGLDD